MAAQPYHAWQQPEQGLRGKPCQGPSAAQGGSGSHGRERHFVPEKQQSHIFTIPSPVK